MDSNQTPDSHDRNEDAYDENPGESKKSQLLKDKSFWGLAITQFLGAFNDNLYKQMMLLMALPGVAAAVKGGDRQGWATALFSLPFVLLSSYAGFLSDRYSKSSIIVICKFAEIGITLLAVLAFLFYGDLGDWGTWSVLFLMGVHSTFFGPGKYGVLPELFKKEDAPRANGLILMSTFLAIILGVVLAGVIKDLLVIKNADDTEDFSRLWIGSLVCTGVAVIGTVFSMMIRKTPPAQPNAKLAMADFVASDEVRKLFKRDTPLLIAIVVSSVFWLTGGIVMPVVNAMGKLQMKLESDGAVSVLTGGLAIGIIIGAVCANLVLKQMKAATQVRLGLLIMIASMIILGLWLPGGKQMLGYVGTLLFLILAGIGAAVFVIPLQVFLQQRPPAEIKGRMIATMNFANFVGILLAGPLYQLFVEISSGLGWPVSSVFWMMSLLLLPLVLFYRLPND